MFIYVITALCIIILYLSFRKLSKLFYGREVYHYILKVPGPPGNYLGNLFLLHTTRKKIFALREEFAKKYYPIYKMCGLRMGGVCVIIPEDIKLIVSNPKYNKKGIAYKNMKNWLKDSIFITHGEKWYKRRRILNTQFHFSMLHQFVKVFNKYANVLVEDFQKQSHKPFVEVEPILSDFTLKCILETFMGVELNFMTEELKKFEEAVEEVLKIYTYRFFRPWLVNNILRFLTPIMTLREIKSLRILHNFSENIIKKREESFDYTHSSVKDEIEREGKRFTMLDLLLSKKATEGFIDFEGIREEVNTFIFGGHDTSSVALSFTLMLLACHKDIQEKIVEEMVEVLGDIKNKPTIEQLYQLNYMERCIKESLRMYPPGNMLFRQLGDDIQLHSGYKLLKDTLIAMDIYGLHHSSHIWSDPEKYDPDRFLPENCKERRPFAFLPFSTGGRNCIGQRFGMLQMKVALCAILANFKLEPIDTPSSIVLVAEIVLKTKEYVRVKFIQR